MFHLTSAADEQLWNSSSLSETVTRARLMLWAYREPAVVLGSGQRLLGARLEANRDSGLEIIVRSAGGGAVLVGPWMLSASIVLPINHPLVSANLIGTYRWLGEAYAEVLQSFGIEARALPVEEARCSQAQPYRSKLSWACYGGLSPWEVVVGQRKIVGLAQTKRRTGVLLVGGLLLTRPEWASLCRFMERPSDEADLLQRHTTSCEDELGEALPLRELSSKLWKSFETALIG